LFAQVNDLPLRIAGDRDLIDGFGRQTVPNQFHEAEKIAGEEKLHDLAPAIGQMLAQANSAAHHLVGVFGGVTFIENGLIAMEA
jgi:hypothetical protein